MGEAHLLHPRYKIKPKKKVNLIYIFETLSQQDYLEQVPLLTIALNRLFDMSNANSELCLFRSQQIDLTRITESVKIKRLNFVALKANNC